MSFYACHLFVCTNHRDSGTSCAAAGADAGVIARLKQGVARLDCADGRPSRVSQSGCLGRCKDGPVLVVYPQASWYRYKNGSDIDEIVSSHMTKGESLARLELPSPGAEGGTR